MLFIDLDKNYGAETRNRRRFWPLRRLQLNQRNNALEFRGLESFSFALRARTSLPGPKLAELYVENEDRLAADVANCERVSQQLTQLLEAEKSGNESLTQGFAAIGVECISKDHEWRGLLSELLESSRATLPYLRLALNHYLEYLHARRQMALSLLEFRADLKLSAPETPTSPSEYGTMSIQLPDTASDGWQGLVRGRRYQIHADNRHTIDLRLGDYPFKLAGGERWVLIDARENSFALHPGVNTIGRSRDNDVTLPANLRNVSRRHVTVETLNGSTLVVTDHSSAGTSVKRAAILSQ